MLEDLPNGIHRGLVSQIIMVYSSIPKLGGSRVRGSSIFGTTSISMAKLHGIFKPVFPAEDYPRPLLCIVL